VSGPSVDRPPTGERGRIGRFILVGLGATAAHYLALAALVDLAGVPSVGLANLAAAAVGIATSYLGNHRVVFASNRRHRSAMPRFLLSYGVVMGIHGAFLALWSDVWGLDYTVGFVLATGASAVATYLANRLFVFTAAAAPARTPP